MGYHSRLFMGAAALAAASALAGSAQAAYFVNAFARLGTDVQGGVVQNGPTSATSEVNNGGISRVSVDLATGKQRSYLSFYGPDVTGGDVGITGAVFGDRVTFNGDTNASFSYNFDGIAQTAGVDDGNAPNVSILIFASLRVFAASAGATANNFFTQSGALVSDTFQLSFNSLDSNLYESFNEGLSGSFAALSGGQYDVFASFSTGAALNGAPISVDFDFMNTGTLGIATTNGVTYSSDSGVLVGSVPGGPGAVPEPATWALMIGGFGLAGAALRRRKSLAA